MRIIVIEDDADIKEILDYILNEDGHEVISWSDGALLDAIYEIDPDLILMDEILSGPSGSTLCKRLKNCADTSAIPVVLLSAMPNLDQTASACGADAYIEKPFNIDALIDVIHRFAKP